MAFSIAFDQAILRGDHLDIEGRSPAPLDEISAIGVVVRRGNRTDSAFVVTPGSSPWTARFPVKRAGEADWAAHQEVRAFGYELRIDANETTTAWAQTLPIMPPKKP